MTVVGIGASAGGLDAFTQLLHALPRNPGFAIVLVQHLAPQHESALANLLAMQTSLPVVQATDGMRRRARPRLRHPAERPGGACGRTACSASCRARPTGRSTRPIDAFLRSLAEVAQERAIGVILSGTASDGTQGVRDINAPRRVHLRADARDGQVRRHAAGRDRDRAGRSRGLAGRDRGGARAAEPHTA